MQCYNMFVLLWFSPNRLVKYIFWTNNWWRPSLLVHWNVLWLQNSSSRQQSEVLINFTYFLLDIQAHIMLFVASSFFSAEGAAIRGSQSLLLLPFLQFPFSSSAFWADLCNIHKVTPWASTVGRTGLTVSMSLFRNVGKTHLCISQPWS